VLLAGFCHSDQIFFGYQNFRLFICLLWFSRTRPKARQITKRKSRKLEMHVTQAQERKWRFFGAPICAKKEIGSAKKAQIREF
jgi:hypothetical protein